MQLKVYRYMIFNLVWLPARQTGSSTRTKVLLRIMLRDITVCEQDLVKQALSTSNSASCSPEVRAELSSFDQSRETSLS